MRLLGFWLIGALLSTSPVAAPSAHAEAVPVFSDTGPDAADYGAAEGYPTGEPNAAFKQSNVVGRLSRTDTAYRYRYIRRAGPVSPLRRAPAELTVSYIFDGRARSLADYMARRPVMGLLIARGDTILFEHYQYARTDHDRFTSATLASALIALMVGAALDDGAIRSIDQSADSYASDIVGTALGATSIRDLLHMASGVRVGDTSQGFAFDSGQVGLGEVGAGQAGTGQIGAQVDSAMFGRSFASSAEMVRRFNNRFARPGTEFSYSLAQSVALALVVKSATHLPTGAYFSARIWRRLGAEDEATWGFGPTGEDSALCCFNARLRDYARLALMLANDGTWNGQQVISRQWLVEATTLRPSDGFLTPARLGRFGFGYHLNLFPGSRRMFAMLGNRGQLIFVDPTSRTVLVQISAPWRIDPERPPIFETMALWRAVIGVSAPANPSLTSPAAE